MTLVTGAIWHIASDRSKHRNSMGVLGGGCLGWGSGVLRGCIFQDPIYLFINASSLNSSSVQINSR